MENQPTQPGGGSPEMPINPNPVQPNAPVNSEVPTPPTGLPPTDDVVFQSSKKKSKGPIIALISIIAVLLIGGGAFAAAYFINNQPENILMSSLNNLLNAEQVEMEGSIDVSLQESQSFGLESLSIKFDEKNAGFSNSTTATLNMNLTNGNSVPAIELGEVMLNNGVLYIEASGLKNFYDSAFRDTLKTTLMNQLLYGYQTNTVSDCLVTDDAEDTNCVTKEVAIDPTTEATVSQMIDEILNQVGQIISSIDGQWIEISLKDILNDEMFASMPATTRQSITDSYDCTVRVLGQASNYADEYSNLYSQNPFVKMTAGNDSYYNINFDATNLAGYINGAAKTKFVSDIANCYSTTNTTIPDTTSNVTAEDIAKVLEYAPQISAKFDGLFDHHLTDLKMTQQNDYFSLTANLKFSYPQNITINAPDSYRPAMDVVKEVYQGIGALQTTMLSQPVTEN